ncbi:thiamine pyrophosphate-binding protein [Pseudoalteromonas denitrificans]|uniref:Acetolactate synthase-1/2/3 large subunit n=1 Tax=Pseudoalteromonas denitrificans DSM 6059 TaxID=1123010 RepID=A0A1I1RQG6_9GAMM|nr:thiamine pyrophosphate-binding protein [Pseudoalteromonas denitrificans]SFD36412.1 acetolactate synthase-1/2/3 large subunit [Pseudoalteromonas denitrificans DSM 6059]
MTIIMHKKEKSLLVNKQETYADFIIRYLSELQSQFVFGVPGGAIEPFVDALARSERDSGIKFIVARHEAGAAFMADGFSRETGKLGVCCATTGPGATNLLTGIACAYADNIPMLVITAQTAIVKFGSGALQDSSCSAIDIIAIFKHCTRYSSLVSHTQQLERKLKTAIITAFTEPKGPVHLSIPSDILNEVTHKVPLQKVKSLTSPRWMYDHYAYGLLCIKLSSAKRIAFFIGQGAQGCGNVIMQLAHKLQAPVICGMMGKAWVDETDPLFYGVYGFAGHQKAKDLIEEQDFEVLIAIGTQLEELGTNGGDSQLLSHKLIHIDQNSEHFSRSTMACLHLHGHIPCILDALLNESQILTKEPLEKISNKSLLFDLPAVSKVNNVLHPAVLFYFLSQNLPFKTRTFIDAGNAWAWASHYFLHSDNNGCFRIATGFGAMAWAIGAAVGSACTVIDALTICITGDGSYLMSAQEITVAQQQKLPLIIIVLNDSALGMVKHGQQLGGAEQIGYQLPHINFAAMAQAMNINNIVIKNQIELSAINWLKLSKLEGPTLIDIHIDPNAVPPMGDRVQGLATSERV